jgi:chromosome segregation ATPase
MDENQPHYSSLKESIDKVTDKARSIAKRLSEIEREIYDLMRSKHDLEARVRTLESEDIEVLKKHVYEIDSKVRSFESDHDKRKQSWNMALNFFVQLLWVSMAAWLLTKLGLQGPL